MKKSLAAVLATSLAGALLGAAPVTASAADCTDPTHPIDQSLTVPQQLAVGVKKVKTLTLNVYSYDGCPVTGVTAALQTPRGTVRRVTFDRIATADGLTHWQGSIVLKPTTLRNADAGTWETTYRIAGGQPYAFAVDNQVQRASRLSFNAGPEPIRNQRITLSGKLERANWNSRRYLGYAERRIDLYRTFGDEDAQLVGRTVTNGNGGYRVRRTFPGSGAYRAEFAGSTTTFSADSRIDHVIG